MRDELESHLQPESQPKTGHDALDNESSSQDEALFSLSPFEDWWTLQICALLLSAFLLVTTCLVLHYYDGRPQPGWSLISLNALISWLSTFSKALVLFPVACCLGQLKWVWMVDEPRALSDLRSFDTASRGVAGSAQALFSKQGRHVSKGTSDSHFVLTKVQEFPSVCWLYSDDSVYCLWSISAEPHTLLSKECGGCHSKSTHYKRLIIRRHQASGLTRQRDSHCDHRPNSRRECLQFSFPKRP